MVENLSLKKAFLTQKCAGASGIAADKDCEGERSHARYWARSNCCASKLGKHFAHLGGKWDLVWGEVLCSPGAIQTDGGAEPHLKEPICATSQPLGNTLDLFGVQKNQEGPLNIFAPSRFP